MAKIQNGAKMPRLVDLVARMLVFDDSATIYIDTRAESNRQMHEDSEMIFSYGDGKFGCADG